MSKRKQHIHKYQRISIGEFKVWSCALPDCQHYMPKHMEQMIPGKGTICWNCLEECLMGPIQMNMIRPFCDDCLLGGGTLNSILPPAPTIASIHEPDIEDGSILPPEVIKEMTIEERMKKAGMDPIGFKKMYNTMAKPDSTNKE